MKSIVEFWSVFPIFLLFLFHTQILNFFGIPMAYTRGRSNLVKNLVSKMEQDQKLEEFDKSKWYSVNLENIKSSEIKSKFVQLDADTETQSQHRDGLCQPLGPGDLWVACSHTSAERREITKPFTALQIV